MRNLVIRSKRHGSPQDQPTQHQRQRDHERPAQRPTVRPASAGGLERPDLMADKGKSARQSDPDRQGEEIVHADINQDCRRDVINQSARRGNSREAHHALAM